MKHKWQKLGNGEINDFAMSEGFHNGPVCVECGFHFCEHCQPEERESECPGRAGFQVYRDNKTYNWNGKLLGIRWKDKCLFVGIWFITICFDFSGLFPYCEEVKDE